MTTRNSDVPTTCRLCQLKGCTGRPYNVHLLLIYSSNCTYFYICKQPHRLQMKASFSENVSRAKGPGY